jgi:hypothetical protein
VDAAATLMGLGRRQIYRLHRAFSGNLTQSGGSGDAESRAPDTAQRYRPERAFLRIGRNCIARSFSFDVLCALKTVIG